jgi:hypothetical protein
VRRQVARSQEDGARNPYAFPMQIIEASDGHPVLWLSSAEILALVKAFLNVKNNVKNGLDGKSFLGYVGLSAKQADEVERQLREALKLAHDARRNRPA